MRVFAVAALALVLCGAEPKCSVGSRPDGHVLTVEDGTGTSRCAAVITPARSSPLPVLFWFHGAHGSAAGCGDHPLAQLAVHHGFALVCGEAVQSAMGGQWKFPDVINNSTCNPCEPGKDSYDLTYLRNVGEQLAAEPEKYDTSRLFFSGCSQGSAFSFYSGSCTKQLFKDRVSAFATHSTGLHVRGDGLSWPKALCDQCTYIPAYPQAYRDNLGLKACVFDNTEDPLSKNPFFYLSSKQLAQTWRRLGNRVEEHYSSGGHCQIQNYTQIVACLDDGTGRLLTTAGNITLMV